jgi:hypothetical protein
MSEAKLAAVHTRAAYPAVPFNLPHSLTLLSSGLTRDEATNLARRPVRLPFLVWTTAADGFVEKQERRHPRSGATVRLLGPSNGFRSAVIRCQDAECQLPPEAAVGCLQKRKLVHVRTRRSFLSGRRHTSLPSASGQPAAPSYDPEGATNPLPTFVALRSAPRSCHSQSSELPRETYADA